MWKDRLEMKHLIRKRSICFLLILSLCVPLLSGCQIGNTKFVWKSSMNKSIAFSINEEKCSVEEVKLYLCNYKNLYGTAYSLDLWKYDFGQGEGSLEQYIKDVTLYEVSKIVCMSILAKENDITLTKEEEELIEKVTDEYYDTLSKEEIKYIGLTKNKLEEYYTNYALAMKLYDMLTQGVNEEVSDDEARVIKVQHIYVNNVSIATTIQGRLKAGEDFASVANTYNEFQEVECYVSRDMYPQEVEDIAFDLDDNEVSGMIKAEDGYYFVKCLNHYEKERTEANKSNILYQREQALFDSSYQEFIDNAKFKLNKEVWDEINFDDTDIQTDSFFAVYNKYFLED